MKRCRDYVVGGLTEIDMIVGMENVPIIGVFAHNQTRPTSQNLVHIGIGRGAGPGLKNIDHKLIIEPPGNNFSGGFDYGTGFLSRKRAVSSIDSGSAELDQSQGADKLWCQSQITDGEVLHGSLGACSIERTGGYRHLSHRVSFYSGKATFHNSYAPT